MSERPLSELHPGDRVQATIVSHEPFGLLRVKINGYEQVGASLDIFRHNSDPGVRRLSHNLPPVGTTIQLIVVELRPWHQMPWIWVDLTRAPRSCADYVAAR